MYKSYKVAMKPSIQQINAFEFDFYVCRVVHNLFMRNALRQYDECGTVLSVNDFLNWFYDVFLERPDVSDRIPRHFNTVAVRHVCQNANKSLIKYQQGKSGRPSPKKKDSPVSIYIPASKFRNREPLCEYNRIFLPRYGWISLREKNYIPTSDLTHKLVNCYVTKDNDMYFVSATFEEPESKASPHSYSDPIGIDLGVVNFAILSDGRIFPNINKTRRVENLEKRLKRQHRALHRKDKGEQNGANYIKNRKQLDQTYFRLKNIRADYICKVVAEIIKSRPKYIAIEDLDVTDMISDRRFSQNVSKQMFYEFREELARKCRESGIELRLVYRYFPSTKLCHNCGRIKRNMTHNDRVYICECGYTADRDLNASLNIRDALDYTVIS